MLLRAFAIPLIRLVTRVFAQLFQDDCVAMIELAPDMDRFLAVATKLGVAL